MKIAVCSDIHDQLANLERALAGMAQADALLFCGDLCAPFTLKALAEGFPGPVHTVWGNNDGDKWLLTEIAHQAGNVTLHGEFAELDLDGYRVALVHYPRLGQALAHSRLYDLVCYGHNHQPFTGQVETTLLLNPGELLGRFGRVTYAIVDSEAGQAQIHEVG